MVLAFLAPFVFGLALRARHENAAPGAPERRSRLSIWESVYTTPNANMASATFLKPAMFAPRT